jgi:hypothetical protein
MGSVKIWGIKTICAFRHKANDVVKERKIPGPNVPKRRRREFKDKVSLE